MSSCVQERETNSMQQVQVRATKAGRVLEHIMQNKRLRELVCSVWRKEGYGEILLMYITDFYTTGWTRQAFWKSVVIEQKAKTEGGTQEIPVRC